MKNSKWLLLAGLAIVLMTIGCQDRMGFVEPKGGDVKAAVLPPLQIPYGGNNWFLYFDNFTPDGPTVYPMSIGQDNGATGSYVKVWKDGEQLFVEFTGAGDWYISVAHVDVALTKGGLHHNKNGGLVPGKFLYKKEYNVPYPHVALVTIPWNHKWDGKQLFMAALCNIAEGAQDAAGVWHYWNWNTGCGGKGELPPPSKELNLPPDCVSMVLTGSGEPYARFNVQFYSADIQPGGPWSVKDGVEYAAWSMDEVHSIVSGDFYSVHLWSCFDPALPLEYHHAHWGAVAWLINNRQEWGALTMDDMQVIFYHLLDQTDNYPLPVSGPVYDLYIKALGHDTFRPATAGSWVPVVCQPSDAWKTDFQVLFAEIDP